MNERKIRVTLSGDVLEDADKILAATHIKKYSELVAILIKRYGGALIVDYNNFYNPSWDEKIPSTSPSMSPIGQNTPTRDEKNPNVSLSGSLLEQNSPTKDKNIPQVAPNAKKTGRQLLMDDFED